MNRKILDTIVMFFPGDYRIRLIADFALRRWNRHCRAGLSRKSLTPTGEVSTQVVDLINVLKRYDIRISMDGRGRALDNAFIERFRRTVKYEEIYLNHYDSVWELEDRLTAWFDFCCNRRRHSALNYCYPAELFFGSAAAGKESLRKILDTITKFDRWATS